jgi:hypothetical protein
MIVHRKAQPDNGRSLLCEPDETRDKSHSECTVMGLNGSNSIQCINQNYPSFLAVSSKNFAIMALLLITAIEERTGKWARNTKMAPMLNLECGSCHYYTWQTKLRLGPVMIRGTRSYGMFMS